MLCMRGKFRGFLDAGSALHKLPFPGTRNHRRRRKSLHYLHQSNRQIWSIPGILCLRKYQSSSNFYRKRCKQMPLPCNNHLLPPCLRNHAINRVLPSYSTAQHHNRTISRRNQYQGPLLVFKYLMMMHCPTARATASSMHISL